MGRTFPLPTTPFHPPRAAAARRPNLLHPHFGAPSSQPRPTHFLPTVQPATTRGHAETPSSPLSSPVQRAVFRRSGPAAPRSLAQPSQLSPVPTKNTKTGPRHKRGRFWRGDPRRTGHPGPPWPRKSTPLLHPPASWAAAGRPRTPARGAGSYPRLPQRSGHPPHLNPSPRGAAPVHQHHGLHGRAAGPPPPGREVLSPRSNPHSSPTPRPTAALAPRIVTAAGREKAGAQGGLAPGRLPPAERGSEAGPSVPAWRARGAPAPRRGRRPRAAPTSLPPASPSPKTRPARPHQPPRSPGRKTPPGSGRTEPQAPQPAAPTPSPVASSDPGAHRAPGNPRPAAGSAHLRARRTHAGGGGASTRELKVRAKAAGTAGGGARRRLSRVGARVLADAADTPAGSGTRRGPPPAPSEEVDNSLWAPSEGLVRDPYFFYFYFFSVGGAGFVELQGPGPVARKAPGRNAAGLACQRGGARGGGRGMGRVAEPPRRDEGPVAPHARAGRGGPALFNSFFLKFF